MAARFLKALTIEWGIDNSVGIPVYIDKAVRFLTPDLNLSNMSLVLSEITSGPRIEPLSYAEIMFML